MQSTTIRRTLVPVPDHPTNQATALELIDRASAILHAVTFTPIERSDQLAVITAMEHIELARELIKPPD